MLCCIQWPCVMTMTKLNNYRQIIGYSYLLYIVVIVPVSLIHELGHTAVCSVGGYQFRIWLDFRGGHSICYGILGNNSVIAAMGGIFGLLTSLGILAIWYCFSKKIVALAVVSLALALDQGLKIFLEVFFPRQYSAGMFDLLITILQIISVALFAIYFARKQREKYNNLSLHKELGLDT
jgi:glycerol-3-phosphate acyltransferase PlsY